MSGEPTAEKDPESRLGSIRYEPKKNPKRAYFTGAFGVVLGLFSGYSIGADSIPPAPLPVQGSSYTPQRPTGDLIPGNGTFRVGTGRGADVRPGLYRSSGNTASCTWRRSMDATWESDSILAHDTSLGDAYVQLNDGEFFDSTNCATWRRVEPFVRPR